MRFDACAVMTFKPWLTPGMIMCSMPEYRSSVFSRTMTRLIPSKRDSTPATVFTGLKFE